MGLSFLIVGSRQEEGCLGCMEIWGFTYHGRRAGVIINAALFLAACLAL